MLGDAYEERGMFEKAVNYHELAGSPKEKIAAIKEKAAKALLNAADKSAERDAKQYYLTSVSTRTRVLRRPRKRLKNSPNWPRKKIRACA